MSHVHPTTLKIIEAAVRTFDSFVLVSATDLNAFPRVSQVDRRPNHSALTVLNAVKRYFPVTA